MYYRCTVRDAEEAMEAGADALVALRAYEAHKATEGISPGVPKFGRAWREKQRLQAAAICAAEHAHQAWGILVDGGTK